MIRVRFHTANDTIVGFTLSGHAGAGAHGQDIVCAAVSSAAYMAANTITEIEKAHADIDLDNGKLTFIITDGCTDGCITILEGLKLHLSELEKQNNGYLTIKTEAN